MFRAVFKGSPFHLDPFSVFLFAHFQPKKSKSNGLHFGHHLGLT